VFLVVDWMQSKISVTKAFLHIKKRFGSDWLDAVVTLLFDSPFILSLLYSGLLNWGFFFHHLSMSGKSVDVI